MTRPTSLPSMACQTLTLAVLIGASVAPTHAATLAASFSFQQTLQANEALAPALTAIDPLAQNTFESAVVNGQSQTVYHWVGNGQASGLQAGLTLNATGLVPYNDYSVAMKIEFLSQAAFGGGWRRLVDTEGRQSDNGFYVNPANKLEVVQGPPAAAGPTTFTTPGFHEVVLSVSPEANGSQLVKGYLDGQLEFAKVLNAYSLDNANNPGHLLTFFADNLAAGAQQEYADGRIASLKLYSGAFDPTTAVPEPASMALLAAGLGVLTLARQRKPMISSKSSTGAK